MASGLLRALDAVLTVRRYSESVPCLVINALEGAECANKRSSEAPCPGQRADGRLATDGQERVRRPPATSNADEVVDRSRPEATRNVNLRRDLHRAPGNLLRLLGEHSAR